MKISIFGMGYVGVVSGACLCDLGHEVIGVDKNPTKVDLINGAKTPIVEPGVAERIEAAVADGRMRATTDAAEAVAASEVSLISVGTPSAANGMPILTAVDAVSAEIGDAIGAKDGDHAVVVRSTIVPGYTEDRIGVLLSQHAGRPVGPRMPLYFNPEFLREGSAVSDFYKPPFTIFGAAAANRDLPLDGLYQGIDAPVFQTDCRTAESVKYLSNAFHALKITFANEAGTLLKGLGIDSREALRIFCEDRDLNISPAYLRPGFAFGGSCLPKELRAIQALARSRDIELPMLSQLLPSNARHIERAFEMVTAHGRHRIALFGLSFKRGTDDMRESPLVALAERLIGKGYDVAIYDRDVELGRLIGANREFIEREIPHFERLMADTPEAALEDAKVVVIGHVGDAEREAILAAADDRIVIDLQGVRQLEERFGNSYHGICW